MTGFFFIWLCAKKATDFSRLFLIGDEVPD